MDKNKDSNNNKKFLESQINIWKDTGLLNEKQYNELIKGYDLKSTIAKQNNKLIYSFPLILTILGIILVILGIGTFLTLNWSVIPTVLQMIIVFLSIIGIYVFSYFFASENNKYAKLGKSFIVLGSLAYGAGIFLLINILNINVSLDIPLLVWAIGTLAIAILEKNEVIFDISALLFTVWSIISYLIGFNYIIVYFIAFLVIFALSIYFKFKSTLLINVISFCVGINFLNDFNNFVVFNLTYFLTAYLLFKIIPNNLINIQDSKFLKNIFLIVSLILGSVFSIYIYNEAFINNNLILLFTFLLGIGINIYLIVKSFIEKNKNENFINFTFLFTFIIILLSIISFGQYEYNFLIKSYVLTVLYSIFFLGIVIYIIKYSIKTKNIQIITLSIILFGLTLIVKMIDYNWSLFEKSIYFILIGLALIGYNLCLKNNVDIKKWLTTFKLTNGGNDVSENKNNN